MDSEREAWKKFTLISAFGLTIGVTMLVCGGLGVWLDGRLGTSPIFTSVLFLAGGASALWYGIVKFLK